MCSRKECSDKYPCYCRTCHVEKEPDLPPSSSVLHKKTQTKPQLSHDWRDEDTSRKLLNFTRRATRDDLESIKSLMGSDSTKIFGEANLPKLVEQALLFQLILNFENRVIAAICLNDFPPVKFLTDNDWADWFQTKYNCSKFQSTNTLWIHYLAYAAKYKDIVFDHLFAPIFLEFHYIQSLAIYVEKDKFNNNYLPQFNHIGQTIDEYKRPTLNENDKMIDIPVFYLDRDECVYTLNLRPATPEDETAVVKTISKDTPELLKYYGKDLFKHLLNDPNRCILVAPHETGRAGVILLNKSIDYTPIQEKFETEYFNGFKRGSDVTETWCNHYYPKKQVECEEEVLSKVQSFSTIIPTKTEDEVVHNAREEDVFNVTVLTGLTWSSLLMHDAQDWNDEEEITVDKSNTHSNNAIEFTRMRNLCMSICSSDDLRYSPREKKYEVKSVMFEKYPNAVMIELFLMGDHHYRFCNEFLAKLFKEYPAVNFTLMFQSEHSKDNYHTKHMTHVPHRKGIVSTKPLFALHKWQLTTASVTRKATLFDFDEILHLTSQFVESKIVQNDVFACITGQKNNATALVYEVENMIVGISVVGPNTDLRFYRFQYHVDWYMDWRQYRLDEIGSVKHLMISSVFEGNTRDFLKGCMKIMGWKSMFFCLYSLDASLGLKASDYTVPMGLNQWVPLVPRVTMNYPPSLEDKVPPLSLRNTDPPFALYYIKYPFASFNKNINRTKIVIIGKGETAMSFIEHFFYSDLSPYELFTTVTVVTSHVPVGSFRHANVINTMCPASGKFNMKYIVRMGLDTWVKCVHGTMTAINREKKVIIIDERHQIPYDYLFLFCGKQYLTPMADKKHLVHSRTCKVPVDLKFSWKKTLIEIPDNLFTLNCYYDAHYALEYLASLTPTKTGKVIVYGNSPDALACLEGLIHFGIPSHRLVYVECNLNCPYSIDHFNDPSVYKTIRQIIAVNRIAHYFYYNFLNWDVNPQTLLITTAHFESLTKVISLECLALFSYSPKEINISTYGAVTKANLVYDGKLVIDANFKTNDDHIYAAGTFTKYARRYHADQYNHEHYNATEIGAHMAAIARTVLKLPGCRQFDYKLVPNFFKPVVIYGSVPGNRYVLNVRRPGPILPLETLLNNQHDFGRILVTGNLNLSSRQGYFRILLNKNNVINDIVCLSRIPIDARNLPNLYGKNEKLLNSLLLRYQSNYIADLFEFFKEPWAYVFYHDRYETVEDKIMMQLSKKVECSKNSFVELIAFANQASKWKPLPGDSLDLLEDIYNNFPDLKTAVQNIFIEFIEANPDQLPMLVNKDYISQIIGSTEIDVIFDSADDLKGIKPAYNEIAKKKKNVLFKGPMTTYYEQL